MRYVAVAVAVAVALLIGWLAQRRRPDAPVRTGWNVPDQVDRTDFARPDAPFLVAVFTAASCATCHDIMTKATVLESDMVVVHQAEFTADRHLHERYGIDAVPVVLIADANGVVGRSFLGPTSAAHLWAALAELRDPDPPSCLPGGHLPEDDPGH